MGAGSDLPSVEILSAADDGSDEGGPATHRRAGRGPWRWYALALIAMIGALAAWATVRSDDQPDPTLLAWSADHHIGEPPAGVELPSRTDCDADPYNHALIIDCLRSMLDHAVGGAAHLMFDSATSPVAVDVWVSTYDRRITVVRRTVSADPPLRSGPRTNDSETLRWESTVWAIIVCENLNFNTMSVFSSFECNEGFAYTRRQSERRRSLTQEEREDLIRRFACTFPDDYPDLDC